MCARLNNPLIILYYMEGHFVSMYTLNSIISISLMALLFLYPETLRNNVLSLNLTPDCHVSLPYITTFNITRNHQRIQTTRSKASCCHHCNYYHYCNVDIVLFHNVTCYTYSHLSRIHVNTIELLNITWTSVARSAILWSLECSRSLTKITTLKINNKTIKSKRGT